MTDHLITNFQSNALLVRILEATLKGSLILAVAFATTELLRNRSAALRHLVWVTATAAAIAVLLLPSLLPAWHVMPAMSLPAASFGAASSKLPNNVSNDEGLRIVNEKKVSNLASGSNSSDEFVAKPRAVTLTSGQSQPTEPVASTTARPGLAVHMIPNTDSTEFAPTFSASLMLICAWLGGVIFWLGYYTLGGIKVRRLMRTALPVLDTEWIELTEIARKQLQISRPVTLLFSNESEVPLTFGVIFPRIILTADANEWSAQRKHAVIQHELAHIARMDALTQLITHAACAVYWFNPLVWIAAKHVRFERERACDDHVLAAGSPASEYANELLTMVSSFRKSEHYAVALAMARKSQIEGRLVALLNPKLSRKEVSRKTALWVTAATVAFVLPLSAMRPVDTAQQNVATSAAPVVATSGMVGPNSVLAGTPQVAPSLASTESDSTKPVLVPAATAPTQSDEAAAAVPPGMDVHGGMGVGSGSSTGSATATLSGGRGIGRGVGIEDGDESKRDRRTVAAATPPANRQTGFECHQGKGSSSSNMHQTDETVTSWQVKWSGDGCSLLLDAQGEITFNSDFTDFQSISQGGFVDIIWRGDADVSKLSVRPSKSCAGSQSACGTLEYKWFVNDVAQALDVEVRRKWLANLLTAMDRRSAIGIKQRFPKLIQEGGVRRVLEEVSYMDSDYARASYLLKLVQDVQLKPEELQTTMARTAEMGSDYECARVLMAVAGKYSLQEPASRSAFLNAIDTLQSDYEHARVLMAFFQKGRIPSELMKTVLDSASRIKSDYEHARVLMAIFEAGTIPPEMLRAVLESASQLKSDYEHARVLVAMSNRKLVDASTQSDFLASLNTIKSDYEHARTLVAFLEVRRSDEAALLGVIQSVPSIKSDYEAARVLVAVAGGRKLEGNLRDAYIHAAQGIKSDHDRNQALAAVGYRQASL